MMGMMSERELVIVGAGPAGLSAAIAASEAGLPVMVIDENSTPGGQIFVEPSPGFKVENSGKTKADFRRGKALINRIDWDFVDFQMNTKVWDIRKVKNGYALGLSIDGVKSRWVITHQVLIASGVYDRPVPFPGWTLPGVMTVGGAQRLLKSQGIRPGNRVLVAGSGPLLMVLAGQLLDAGAEVVAVLEAAHKAEVLRNSWVLRRSPGRFWEGARHLLKLWSHGVPYLWGHALVQAEGEVRVERVSIAKLDHNYRPISESRSSLEVDAVCTGFGFLPSNQLTFRLGCAHRIGEDPSLRFPYHDETMQTSLPGVYVAGDLTELAGVDVAMAQGSLAGITASIRAGAITPATAHRQEHTLRRKLAKLEPVSQMFSRVFFSHREGLDAILTPETIICRCEGITVAQIDQAVHQSMGSFQDVKLRTRAGMGFCQSRYCGWVINRRLLLTNQNLPADDLYPTIRPPIKPETLGTLAQREEETT